MMLTVAWHSPYTEPPNGLPRILWACSIPWPCDFDEDKLFPPDVPPGYMHYYQHFDLKPHRYWSPESKAKNRIKRMKERVRKKDPLFADQFISKKIANNPDYYDPVKIAEETKRHAAMMAQLEEQEMAEFLEEAGSCKNG